MAGNRAVLFVDDEPRLLEGIKRQLRRQFDVTVAEGADDGLLAVVEHGPFAVIVSDMRMPGIDGAEFLSEVQQLAPDSVRMMLTGFSDQKTAIAAVNQGHIFRFLQKPCESEDLVQNIEAGIRQYALVTAEKEILEQTLAGSIQLLMDILSLSSPAAFSRAERIKYYVKYVAAHLNLGNDWLFEVAAMLGQIGYITVPDDVVEKALTGETLTEQEQGMLSEHARHSCRQLKRIPRLEPIAQMIERADTISPKTALGDVVVIGAQMLRVANRFDALLSQGLSFEETQQRILEHGGEFNVDVVQAFQQIPPPMKQKVLRTVSVRDLKAGMVLDEDIRTRNNMLIVSKGQVVSELMRHRLENFIVQRTINEHAHVYVEESIFSHEDVDS